MDGWYRRVVTFLASNLFFTIVWVMSIVQASWLAIVSRYPMAFDEAYHYNLVKLHANQLNPLFLSQPPGPAPYGALVRDPSWLHHYILSWPFRILDLLGANEYAKIVTLRLCNVLFFAVGIYLFRKLLLRTRASRAAIHAAILFYVLLPTVPLLAGQINYDNLQFPLIALGLLLACGAAESIRRKKIDALKLTACLGVLLTGTLNKFTYLPYLAAVVTYLGYLLVKVYGKKLPLLVRQFKVSWAKQQLLVRRAVLGLLATTSVLFVWFYGVNTVVYHNPVIQCHQVIEPSRCEGFEPWLRNYTLAQEAQKPSHNPLKFTVDWIGGMFYRTTFTINGATGPKRYNNSVPNGMAGTAILLTVAGVVLLLRYGKRIVSGDSALQLILFCSVVYLVALWGRNYNDFLHLGQMVAINGRYLQPVLIPFTVLVIATYQWAFRLMPAVKLVILAVSLLGFLSGGGIIAFIHYSDADWYFEGKPWMISINQTLRKLVAPLFLWM